MAQIYVRGHGGNQLTPKIGIRILGMTGHGDLYPLDSRQGSGIDPPGVPGQPRAHDLGDRVADRAGASPGNCATAIAHATQPQSLEKCSVGGPVRTEAQWGHGDIGCPIQLD